MIFTPRFVVAMLLALVAAAAGADTVQAQGVFRGRVFYLNGSRVGANEVEVKVYCMSGTQVVELGYSQTHVFNATLQTNFTVPITSTSCPAGLSNVLVSFRQLASNQIYVFSTSFVCSDVVNKTTTWNPPTRLNYNRPTYTYAADDLSVTTCCETPSPRAPSGHRRKGLFGCRR